MSSIWIVNDYAGSLEYGMTYRHYYLAKEFLKKGYDVTIITASYSHFLKKFPDMKGEKYKIENIEGINYLWVKTIKYGDSFSKKRVLKWLQFSAKLYRIGAKVNSKPNYIVCGTTAPFAIKPCIYLSRKYNAKLIFEVRDIWPLTLIEVGGYSKFHPFIQLMHWFEKLALKNSDILISNLQNYSSHIHNIGINRNASWISNGIDSNELHKKEPLDLTIDLKIPKNKFIVGYTGKIGVSNAINYLLEAAEKMQDFADIFFVIVGKGQEKANLEKQYNHLKNILFIDVIPKNQIHSMLALFDICYIGLHKEKLFTYGVSPNKLYDYMYSGKPILYAIESGESNIVDDANCGVTVEAENPEAIKEGILQIYKLSKAERFDMGERGKQSVLSNFTYEKLAEKFISILEGNN